MQHYIISLEEVMCGVKFKSNFIVRATEDTVDDVILNVMKQLRGEAVIDTEEETFNFGDVIVSVVGINEINTDIANELVNNSIITLMQ